jgi:heavy metal sensor kinase
MSLTIRTRMTLWYTALVAALLACFAAGVLAVQSRLSRGQFDAELDGVNRTVASVLRAELSESHNLARAAQETRKSVDIPGRTVAVLDGNGRPLAAHWRGFRRALLPAFHGASWLGTVSDGRDAWRVHITRVSSDDGNYEIVTGGSFDHLAREQRLLAWTLIMSMPLAIMLAAAVCWWTASHALLPLTAMAARAEAITLQSLDVDLAAGGAPDEVGQLAGAFNQLLARLRTALCTQRQFMADASHELRTPISVARTAAEVTLHHTGRDESDYRDALQIVGEQTGRLGRMVDDMLTLATADAGGYPVRRSPLYLDEVFADCMRSLGVIATARGVRLDVRADADVLTDADDGLIRQLFTNLIENALKHTPEGGRVIASLTAADAAATLTVSDTGPGIPEADRERIFERFVRLDPARDSGAGAGLGLPIARWIAEAHGGALAVRASATGGCEFVAVLPLIAHPDPGAVRPRGGATTRALQAV